MTIMKATNITTTRNEEGLFFDISYEPCENVTTTAIKKVGDFLDRFCPYEADEAMEYWVQTIAEDPEKAYNEFEVEIGETEADWDDEILEQLYNDAYDALYECVLCQE